MDGAELSKCYVEGENFVTFDNTSYEAELSQQNYHLLAKDRSGQAKFAVLAKQADQQNKHVKILIGNTQVKLSATGSSSSPPQVQVDGKDVQVSTEGPTEFEDDEGEVELRLVATKDGYIKVSAPQEGIKVASDGERIVITASQLHSNNLAGLCGDFNGEQSADLKTPELCVENQDDAQDFADSYQVSESGQQSPRRQQQQSHSQSGQSAQDSDDSAESQGHGSSGSQSSKKSQSRRNQAVRGCVKEKDVSVAQASAALEGQSSSSHSSSQHGSSSRRQSGHGSSSGHGQSGHGQSSRHQQDDDEDSDEQGPGSSQRRDQTELRHKVVGQQGQKCFSTKMVPQCKQGRTPKNTFAKEVEFICMDASPKSQRLEDQSGQGDNISQDLQELRAKSAGDKHSQKLYLPTTCQ